MRVVYIGHTAALSGGELALANLLPALDGVEARVVLAEDGPLVERLERAGAAVEVLAMDERARGLSRDQVQGAAPGGAAALRSGGYALALARRLRELRPDLVHTYTLKSALYGGVAGRLARTPVVWTIQDRIADDYLPPAAVRLVRAAALVLPAAVVANSAATAATLGRAGRSATVVYPPVPAPVTAGAGAATGPRREGAGGDRPFTAVVIGRISPWKGQHVFVEAFASAFPPPSTARARLVGAPLFGEDDYLAELEGRIAALGLEGRVELTGFTDDVAGELAGADVLVHCSTQPEPFGQVVVEGMAAGVPVVATAGGGPTEIVTDGVDGLLVPPGDAGALAKALDRLAGDTGLRSRLAMAGRDRAAAFVPAVAAEGVLAVYRRVCV